MIKKGQKKKARYWGKFEVKKVAELKEPVICHSQEVGQAEFSPTIVQIDWENPPSPDKHEYWFPYWIKISGKEKYGQFAPMIGRNALLQLLQEAIRQDFFDNDFLVELGKSLRDKIEKNQNEI
jgi:hypothetical protein